MANRIRQSNSPTQSPQSGDVKTLCATLISTAQQLENVLMELMDAEINPAANIESLEKREAVLFEAETNLLLQLSDTPARSYSEIVQKLQAWLQCTPVGAPSPSEKLVRGAVCELLGVTEK